MTMRSLSAGLLLLLSAKALAEPVDFSVLSYNVFLRSPTWMFHDQHDWRGTRIPQFLRGHDAVVLQEAFSPRHRQAMIEALADEYPYWSEPLGQDQLLSQNGGVVILSRWPILHQNQTVFEACGGVDCMVKKGVVHTTIEKLGRPIHLFGLHLQADADNAAVRSAQLGELKAFVDQQAIAPEEPVLIAGDFNVDALSDASNQELSRLQEQLQLHLPQDDLVATYSDTTNSIIDAAVEERLDYVFYSGRHAPPDHAMSEIRHIRVEGRDLSDHHAVVARFRFGGAE